MKRVSSISGRVLGILLVLARCLALAFSSLVLAWALRLSVLLAFHGAVCCCSFSDHPDVRQAFAGTGQCLSAWPTIIDVGHHLTPHLLITLAEPVEAFLLSERAHSQRGHGGLIHIADRYLEGEEGDLLVLVSHGHHLVRAHVRICLHEDAQRREVLQAICHLA